MKRILGPLFDYAIVVFSADVEFRWRRGCCVSSCTLLQELLREVNEEIWIGNKISHKLKTLYLIPNESFPFQGNQFS